MEITGYGTLRFKKVGDRVLWTTSIKVDAKQGTTWMSIPTTLKKEVEDKVKKEFKARKITSEDKYLTINVTKGFLSGYKDKDGKNVLKLVVMELDFPQPKKQEDTELDF